MLSSESMLKPSYIQLPNTDRNVLYTNPADSMFSAPSNFPAIRSQLNLQSGASGNDYNPSDLSQISGGIDGQQFYQPVSGSSGLNGARIGNTNSNNNRFIFTYFTRPPPGSSSSSSSVSSLATATMAPQPGDTVNGYYGDFSGYKLNTGSDTPALSNNQYESYQAAGVHATNLNEQSSQPSPSYVQIQNGNEYQASVYENDIPSQHATSASPFELNSSSSIDNPVSLYTQRTLARNKQHQSHAPISPSAAQNSITPPGIASSSKSSTPRRSGPVSLKLDDATREKINSLQRNNRQKHWSAPLQSPAVIELSDTDLKALSAMSSNYRSSYPSTSPSSGSSASTSSRSASFVPIIAADGAKTTNTAEHSIRASRIDSNTSGENVQFPSSIGGDNHASTSKSSQQTRQQGQARQQVSYTIIRPKPSSVKPEASPEATGQLQSDTDTGLRSFTGKAAGASWSAMTPKEIAASGDSNQDQAVDNNNNDNSNHHHHNHHNNNQESPSSGSQAEHVSLHRVSRTPNHSSVKQQVVAQTSGSLSENSKASVSSGITDYELAAASENSGNKLLPPPIAAAAAASPSASGGYSNKGLKSNIQASPYTVDSSYLNSSGEDKWQQQVSRKQAAANEQLVTAHNDRQAAVESGSAGSSVEDNSTTNDDELKTTANLIQLSADNSENDSASDNSGRNHDDNNNNVKLIEASSEPQQQQQQQQQVAESADKLADTSLVIMLPTARNGGQSSGTSERRATSMKSTGELTSSELALKQRHKMNPTSESSNANDEQFSNRGGKVADRDKREPIQAASSPSTSSDNNTNEDISPDTPFGGFLGAGYSLGGQ